MFRNPRVLAMALVCTACAGSHRSEAPQVDQQTSGGTAEATTKKHDANTANTANTAKTRATPDKSDQPTDQTPSVFRQGNDEIDLDITQRIRKQLIEDDALSFSAKNIKIVTQDGVVTLQGSVKSEDEAKEVRSKAIAEAGQGRVKDLLEVSH